MGLHIPPKRGSVLKRLTVVIKPDADKGSYAFPNTFDILSVSASDPGRFRLYRDASAREKDANRAPETDPEPAGGVILDAVFVKDRLTLNLSPLPWGSPATKDQPCFWAWSGKADQSQSITLELLQVEP